VFAAIDKTPHGKTCAAIVGTRSIHGVAHGPSGEKIRCISKSQMYRFGSQRIGEQSLAHGRRSQIASVAMAAAAMIAAAKQGTTKSNVS
jgi:hypothetical protein